MEPKISPIESLVGIVVPEEEQPVPIVYAVQWNNNYTSVEAFVKMSLLSDGLRKAILCELGINFMYISSKLNTKKGRRIY